MSDQPPPAPSPQAPPKKKDSGFTWFFLISGGILVVLTLGCVLAVSDGKLFSEDGELAILCGSPTFILGAVFLWLGTRRLKR